MRIRIRLFIMMRIKILASNNAQTREKVLKQANIPYILDWHLQIDADPVLDPHPAYTISRGSGFLFDEDADPDPDYQNDAYPCGSGSTTLLTDRVGSMYSFYAGA